MSERAGLKDILFYFVIFLSFEWIAMYNQQPTFNRSFYHENIYI